MTFDRLAAATLFLTVFVYVVWCSPGATHYFRTADDMAMLSLGRLFMLGELPGRDLIFSFGPFISLVYAVTLKIDGTPLAIVLAAAADFAFAFAGIFVLLRRECIVWPLLVGCIGVLFALVPFVHLLRWFQWLMPVMLLLVLQWHLRSPRGTLSAAALALVVTAATLCRVDIGAASWFAALAGLASARRFGSLLVFSLAGIFFGLSWLLILWIGNADIPRYVCLLIVSALAFPLTRPAGFFHGWLPFAFLGGFAAIYVACLALAQQAPKERGLLVANAVMGLLMLPGALYFPNLNHVFFVCIPAVIGAAVLGDRLARLHHGRGGSSSAFASLAFLAIALFFGAIAWFGRNAALGAASLSLHPWAKLSELHRGLATTPPEFQKLIGVIDAATPKGDCFVLVSAEVAVAITFYANRRQAGLDLQLNPLLQPSSFQLAANLAAIERARPAVLVTRADDIAPGGVYSDLPFLTEFPVRLAEVGGFLVLGRAGGDGKSFVPPE